MSVKFALKELIAKKERISGEDCTYEVIYKDTGVHPNTLSLIATNKVKRVPVDALDALMTYFECQPGDLIKHIPEPIESQ